MADAKITALTELTSADGADLLPIVDDVAGTPTTKKITLTNIAAWLASLAQTLVNKTLTSPLFQGTVDGWISANESWSYASATTITVPSGAASKYRKGDKIKLTQTTVKYFYVIGVADTVLTVVGETASITVANAAISANYYSHGDPVGFPPYFTWTPTLTGGEADLSGYDQAVYTIDGTKLSFIFNAANRNLTGTTGYIQVTLPVTPSVVMGYRSFHSTLYPVASSYIQIKATATSNYFGLSKGMTSETFVGNETGIYIQVEGSYWI